VSVRFRAPLHRAWLFGVFWLFNYLLGPVPLPFQCGASVLLTGAFHEDGFFADVCDGLEVGLKKDFDDYEDSAIALWCN
jgi:cobalamin synthase